ncbi:MAG: type 2 isopentenyl-diphosphate Delta-isomerase [Candidatus Methanofastidiosa archaeon]|nr:type 2 isopentenyl-diphosphate Delta-isomerase [Candidatus Methanofastidiosa archaeon]HOM96639.1 type 2 isopentenyl-diphosphate Delta-isomerase [Methanofastidiosum sp.]HPX24590.1 type 2 isopentenyl-diphosphate Delta-isomerase [Methanofastidiosum sp.]
MTTERRKFEHIRICLEEDVQSKYNYLNDVSFVHSALPEINFDEIDTTVKIFGKKLSFPLFISAMTGGTDEALKINKAIAKACQATGIGMGLGSQRAMIEDPSLTYTYDVRKYAKSILIIGNIGLPQFVKGYTEKEARYAVREINADMLAVHLNSLQEASQPEGDLFFKDGILILKKLKEKLDFPLIAKETGAGISKETAAYLKFLDGIDVAGLGGTSWSAVEYYRSNDHKETVKKLWNWGIPTPLSIAECKSIGIKTIIGSGGVRSGFDIAKCVSLGAKACGIALPFLKMAVEEDVKGIVREIETIKREFKIAMFLNSCLSVDDLKNKSLFFTGELSALMKQRGMDFQYFNYR